MDENVVTTLNTLIDVCLDNQRGYILEAEGTVDARVASILREMAHHHEKQAAQLDCVLIQLGVNPLHTSSRSLGGPRWAGLHNAIIHENMGQAMRALEETECCALVSYEIALRSAQLSSAVRSVLSRHHTRIEDALHQLLPESRRRSNATCSLDANVQSLELIRF